MKILIYTRRWNKVFFSQLSNLCFADADLYYYSDFKGIGEVWTGDFIYNSVYDNEKLPIPELNDIITRCRFLRSIKKSTAEKLCNRLYVGLDRYFREKKFDYVFMPIIDCYSLDILDRVAKKNHAHVISFVQNFISGYSRFSIRGERVDLHREISEEEVETVLSTLLDNSYAPSFSLNKKVNNIGLLKRCARNFAKERIYYPYKKITTRDPYNYHYNTVGSNDFLGITKTIRDAGYKTLAQIDFQQFNHLVYLPLHFTPEATVDYWCDNLLDVNYEDRVLQLVSQADENTTILVKEHPAMVGRRSESFYNRLKECPKAILIHPYESSNLILEKVDTVIVHTGSVGVEALIRGKRVLCLTKNYYSDIHPNAILIDSISAESLSRPIVDYDNRLFIHDLLDGLFKYKYAAGWDVTEKSDNIEILAKWCKLLIENNSHKDDEIEENNK